MLLELDLENLKVIDDGRIGTAFNQELRHVILDLMDRPGDDRARAVKLKVALQPVCDETGQCESVNVQVYLEHSLPSRKSRVYDMKARKSQRGPMLVFNEMSLDNADQTTIFDDETPDQGI